MSEPKVGKVYRAKIIPPREPHLFSDSDGQRVANALSPGSRAESYGREWIVGKTSFRNGVLTGRIGFEKTEGTAEIWDEEKLDFKEVAIPQGLTAPFAVNLESLQLSFQPRGAIKANGLMRAVRELLSLEGEKWEVESLRRKVSFEEWKDSVQLITRAKFDVKKPNPHYMNTPDLEAVLEQAEAEYAKLEIASKDGLDLEADFLQQTLDHVDRGYGAAEFRGIRSIAGGNTVETTYSTEVGSEDEAVEAIVGVEGEVAPDKMAEIATLGQDNERAIEAGD